MVGADAFRLEAVETLRDLPRHRNGAVRRVRHDLRDGQAVRHCRADAFHDLCGIVDRQRDELRPVTRFPAQPDELGAGRGVRDHDHRMRFGIRKRLRGGGDICRVLLVTRLGDDRRSISARGRLHAGHSVLSVRVVLVENGEPAVTRAGVLADDPVDLVRVACARQE